jgi:hypothetical protein
VTKIAREVSAELETRGVDAVRQLLGALSSAPSAAISRQRSIKLGDVIVTRGEMEDWLKSKGAADARWIKVGAIAAVIAAVLSFLAWAFPLK